MSPIYTPEQLVKELRIRAAGGHEGVEELQIMCGLAADALEAVPSPAPASEAEGPFPFDYAKAALAIPLPKAEEPKPVAWLRMNQQGKTSTGVNDVSYFADLWKSEGDDIRPLYLHPPAGKAVEALTALRASFEASIQPERGADYGLMPMHERAALRARNRIWEGVVAEIDAALSSLKGAE
jgi:hypothetical protein